VRKKYAKFEGSLKGIDSRILVAQVPGGMLTNLENQLREQNAADRLDEVLEEIPRVREELGFIPLVTPTSQIVGTQAVINVLAGERYASITKETKGVLKGEYGATPTAVDAELQARVLDGGEAITCRPADLIDPEFDKLSAELEDLSKERTLHFGEHFEDDVLTYALFPQVGLKFFENRNNPDAFEPVPTGEPEATASAPAAAGETEVYTVGVAGQSFVVSVTPGADQPVIMPAASAPQAAPAPQASGVGFAAPLAGNVVKVLVNVGDSVASGDIVVILEAMKMETEVRASSAGVVSAVPVREGDAVKVGDTLVRL
jgi:oxaloacetate decarboxylase alpha subunit